MSETIAYADGDCALTGLVYRPAGTPRGAVAVYPTIMNQVGVVLAKAQALAEAGYLALVTDFYGKNPDDFDTARELAAEIRPQPFDIVLVRGQSRIARSIPAWLAIVEALEACGLRVRTPDLLADAREDEPGSLTIADRILAMFDRLAKPRR